VPEAIALRQKKAEAYPGCAFGKLAVARWEIVSAEGAHRSSKKGGTAFTPCIQQTALFEISDEV
jgi:hypothetical protein